MSFRSSSCGNFVAEDTAARGRLFPQYLGGRDDCVIVIIGSGMGGGILSDDLADRLDVLRAELPT